MDFVTYEQFGAVGDGVTDDMDAIVRAHAFANEHNLPVRTAADAHYYIGGAAKTAVILTDTDWGTSRITIDDRAVENNKTSVFRVRSRLDPLHPAVSSLSRSQKNLGTAPGIDCYVIVQQSDIRRYIRRGLNQNNGSPQTDNFECKADGTIVHPLLWDFPRVERCDAYPIDPTPLTLRGGFFTTIANGDPSTYNYYARNVVIERSNVTVHGMRHFVTGEGETGAPYSGFLSISRCARVTVRDCFFTPHKIYRTIGAAGKPVSMGSYDVNICSATDVQIRDCCQHDILDTTKWGLIASNFCKNITLDGCIFSRMDAHQGVYNYTIRNSTLGHQGLNAIGSGALTVENCVLYGVYLINFRDDYGSTWDGDVVVRNVVWHPACGRVTSPVLFGGKNDGTHDFGYPCTLPRTITLENVLADDSRTPENYSGMHIFGNYNELMTPLTKDTLAQPFPYAPCRTLTLKNFRTASGKPWTLCENPCLTPAESVITL